MATTYQNVSKGSSGSDVKALQRYLNQNGANLAVDGQFGPKTQAALMKYQSANGLNANGVAGADTWAKLTYVAPVYANTPRGVQYDTNTTTAAQADINDLQGKVSASYISPYTGKVETALDNMLNQGPFSYDFTTDPTYQQQVQRFQQAGQTAMQDTMGEAAALTGGYGNSYASAAGQQAYNSYLTQANDILPDLYSAALNRYTAEHSRLQDNLSAVTGLDDTAYGRFSTDRDANLQLINYNQSVLDKEREQSNWQKEYDYTTRNWKNKNK